MTKPRGGDRIPRDGDAQRPAHTPRVESRKLERVRAFVAGHDGEPLTPELVEEATNTASHDDH